jgi:hypothetical protein
VESRGLRRRDGEGCLLLPSRLVPSVGDYISWVRGSSIIGPFVHVGKLRLAWSNTCSRRNTGEGTRVLLYVDLMISPHFIETSR